MYHSIFIMSTACSQPEQCSFRRLICAVLGQDTLDAVSSYAQVTHTRIQNRTLASLYLFKKGKKSIPALLLVSSASNGQ